MAWSRPFPCGSSRMDLASSPPHLHPGEGCRGRGWLLASTATSLHPCVLHPPGWQEAELSAAGPQEEPLTFWEIEQLGLDAPWALTPHSLRLSQNPEPWLPRKQPVLEFCKGPPVASSSYHHCRFESWPRNEEWPLSSSGLASRSQKGSWTSQIRPHSLHGDHLFTSTST